MTELLLTELYFWYCKHQDVTKKKNVWNRKGNICCFAALIFIPFFVLTVSTESVGNSCIDYSFKKNVIKYCVHVSIDMRSYT